MTRSTLVHTLTIIAALFCMHSQARAQGLAVEFNIELPDEAGDDFVRGTTKDVDEYFSYARCQCTEALEAPPSNCADDPDRVQGLFQVDLEVMGEPITEDPRASLQVGSDCGAEMPDQRECVAITEIADITLNNRARHCVTAKQLMFPTGACERRTAQRNVWLLFDDDGSPSNGFDDVKSRDMPIAVDAEPPDLPDAESIELVPGEESVVVQWEIPIANKPDFYQVLCVRKGAMAPLFETARFLPRYETTARLCPNVEIDGAPESETGDPETPAVLDRLDEVYLCGDTTGSSTRVTIDGLENGVDYQFVLVVVDKAGNYQAAYAGVQQPAPTIDFWEDYQRNGGDAEGGFCLITSTYGDGGGFTNTLRDFRDNTLAQFGLGRAFIELYYDHIAGLGVYAERYTAVRVTFAVVLAPLVGIAALWEYAGPPATLLLVFGAIWLIRRRRRRRSGAVSSDRPGLDHWLWRPRTLATAAAMGVLLAATSALAQPDPYWEEFQPIEDIQPAPDSLWRFSVKVGPYRPDIDSDPGLQGVKPWERVFGRAGILTTFDLDRYFLFPLGQLGVTAGVGFMNRRGSAFVTEMCAGGEDCVDGTATVDDNGDGKPDRSPAKTSFRLIPMSIGAVYRLTVLDDRFRIPVVPYGRVGVSYYLWWITRPNGETAEYPAQDCSSAADDCPANRALGASIGYQVSAGLALRAERLDAQAARSMRTDMGIEHIGFFFEFVYAKVDGFGNEKKLRVGDATWFGGIDFEF